MSRNNWVEGEFQQIWEGWGVPVLFTGPLLSGGFCALAGAVLGARSRLRGSRLSAAMGPPRDRAGSWRHPERGVWGPAARLLPWCGCVAASCWLSCPFPGLQQALQDGAAVLLLPGEWWPHPAPRCPAPGVLLSRVPGVLGELRTAPASSLSWQSRAGTAADAAPGAPCSLHSPSLADQKAAGLFASRATVGTLFLFPPLLAF